MLETQAITNANDKNVIASEEGFVISFVYILPYFFINCFGSVEDLSNDFFIIFFL